MGLKKCFPYFFNTYNSFRNTFNITYDIFQNRNAMFRLPRGPDFSWYRCTTI